MPFNRPDELTERLRKIEKAITQLQRARRLPLSSMDTKAMTVKGLSEMRSENYKREAAGWRINSSGDAEFNNVEIRGSLIELEPGTVGEDALADSAVTRNKIALEAVDGGRIEAVSIGSSHIQDLAVTDAHIENVAVEKLLAGIMQVGTYIRSVDFADTAEGFEGFNIEGTGEAIFTNVIIGNSDFQIDNVGNASFSNVNVSDSLNLMGEDWDTVVKHQFPRGLIAYSSRVPDVTLDTTTEHAVSEVHAQLEHGRMYEIGHNSILITQPNAPTTASPGRISTRIRDGFTNVPDTSSDLVTRATVPITTGSARMTSLENKIIVSCDDNADPSIARNMPSGEHRFLLTAHPLSWGAGSSPQVLDTANGLTNPIILYVKDIGPLVDNTGIDHSGSGGSSGSGTGGSTVQQYTKTYNSTWSASFDDNGNITVSDGEIRQGYYSSADGNQKAWVGFDDAQIQSDLNGASIDKVEFFLYYDHWYNYDGGTAVIGTHSQSGAPLGYQLSQSDAGLKFPTFSRNEGRWITMDASVGTALQSGDARGIMIGPGVTTSKDYYGKARGHSEDKSPKIRITYTK